MELSIHYKVISEDIKVYTQASCRFILFMKRFAKLNNKYIKKSYISILDILVFSLIIYSVIHSYLSLDGKLKDGSVSGSALSSVSALSFISGAFLVFFVFRNLQNSALTNVFSPLVGSEVIIDLDENGIEVNGIAIKGKMGWGEQYAEVSTWRGYLIIMTPKFYCYLPQRALDMPINDLHDWMRAKL